MLILHLRQLINAEAFSTKLQGASVLYRRITETSN